MSVHAVSPVLVGRAKELTALEAALAGAPGAVLVGGEAGVGKTRLIREFADRAAAAGAQVLRGGCLELGPDGLPFAPFTAMLRALVRDIGIEGVAELLPRAATGGLARLLPEFGAAPGDGTGGEERARLFELVLTLLERLAEPRPAILLIEDAHWADRSTRDLLAFLIRNAGAAALLIVVTYRTDELHRGHPLRPLLAELDRLDRVRRLELDRLSRGGVADLLHGLLGKRPSAKLAKKVYERSEGNPLFVEALLEDNGTLASELPESLRDLLLAGVQRLPEETQETLRVASAGGTRIEHALLAAVSGFDDGALTRVLRPAVAANVLVVDGDGYAFRHALIREAVHDDLLPGEHTRLHTRYAEALENDPGLVPTGRAWMELAYHWYSAHDATWALVGAWRAAAEARRALAHAEDLSMLSRVLELWEKVPDAVERIGADRLEVLEAAARAAERAGEPERGVKLATAALREIDERLTAIPTSNAAGTATNGTDTGGDAASGAEVAGYDTRAAILLKRRGRMYNKMARPEFVDDLRAAAKRVPADPASRVRAQVLNTFAAHLRLLVTADEARRAAAESLDIFRRLGDRAGEADAMLTLFCLDTDYEDDPEWLTLAEERGKGVNDYELILRFAVNRSHFLEGAGLHEQAAEVARQGVAQAREYGLARTTGAFLAINLAEPLVSLGRWDEALTVLDQALEQHPEVSVRASLNLLAGEVALARGDLATAAARLAPAAAIASRGVWQKAQDHFAVLRLESALRLAEGRIDDALAAVRNVAAAPDLTDGSRYAWPVLVIGAAACAERRDEEALAELEQRAIWLEAQGPVQRAHRLTFRAEVARARGNLDHADWLTVAATWERIGQRYAQARALVWAAEAAIADGNRTAAAEALGQSAQLADELRAAPLRQRIDNLSRRARISTGATAAGSSTLGLTPRELEVLRLVSEGRSNREIAETLFISAKTASVHVSNILTKLEVTGRGEAAATAHRLGLFEGTPA